MTKKKVKTDEPKPKTKRHNPTPELGIPRSNRQMFTFSENKLLDQITIEICEAWSKDLVSIRKCHEETNENVNQLREANEFFEDTLAIARTDDFFPKLERVIERQQITFDFLEEIRQSCFKTQEQVIGFRKYIEDIVKSLKVKPEINSKKWWRFWQ